MRARISLLTAALCLACLPALPAMAAGGGSGGASTPPQCANGKVWNKKTQKCEEKQAVRDQDSLFEAGRQLAYQGLYGEAIVVLRSAPDQSDKRVLNMLGFSHRKMGMLETGIDYYKRSISADADYALVREYYGEALLEKGDLSGAGKQLAEIERICGRDCEEYAMLHRRIADYKAGKRTHESWSHGYPG